MKSRKKSWLALVLCALVISIAACGGGEDDDKSGSKYNDRDKRPVAEESINKLQTSSGRDSAYVKELDGTWKFGGKALATDAALKADYSSWKDVTVPHTWNEKDAEDGGGNYERTAYWYHKEFQVEKNIEGKRIYVEFLGSNTRTEVYINGEKAGDEHKGGYTAFRYDITDYVKSGTNVMDVKTDNTVNQEIAPISGDFNMYGGIYRRVYLVTVNDVHISLDEDGSSGLFLTTGNMRSKEAPKDLGEFQVKTDFVNSSDKEKTVEAVITVKGDNGPEPITEKVTVPAGGTYELVKDVKVENPTLWEGISYERDGDNAKAGYQYVVTVELKEDGKVIDKVEDKLGFRYFWIDSKDNGDAGEGFFLNGKAYPLRGVNRHSYLAGVGSAMTEEQHRADMDIMLELGVNTVRLCHYPQTDYFYDLCDDKGIVVWTEIPLVNMIGSAAGFEDNVSKQLTELIKQQYNRPSVVFWGLENEIGNGTDLTNATANSNVAKMKKLIYNLDNLARELDTTGRYTTQAVNRDYSMDNNNPDSVNKDFENNKGWKSDTVAWNIYPGWYPDANFYGTFEDVMKRKDVTVSSFEAGNIGENAVDGDAATRWVAVDGTYPQSITVDLGESYYVGNLTLQWDTKGGNRHYMYYVEVSEDGTSFRELLDKRSNTAMGTITDSLNMAKARYIRITATGCNVTGWATLFEIQADGYSITSEKYKIDNDNKLIILDEIPDAGLAEGVFMDNLSIKGNYSYTVNLSSGWINDGNTVDILDLEGNKTATYRICTEDTK